MDGDLELRLLVVDDDSNTRALLCDALEIRGATVVAVANVREATEALRTWHPDLLISDIGMPGDDGYELIRRVRAIAIESGERMPAIACSSHAAAEDHTRALAAGFDALVAKPVDLDLLMNTIDHFTDVGFGGTSDADAPARVDSGGGRVRSAPDS